ncbi:mucin-15 isoform X2 [Neopsephotus bourkii]|uniref:mucin-15 isoform X2 n=1 Tax=Neopsephotus bourkii TaxID=309878 RepID=UPI002AA4FD51|nr:mucin-15 isoform X2 [Neopsephotus bourkii]
MQLSCGKIFIFLLVRLQWNKSNTKGMKVNGAGDSNGSIRDNNWSTVQSTSWRLVPTATTAINPSIISHAAPATANVKENVAETTEMSSQPNSTPPTSTDGTTLSSVATTVSKDGINNSATTFNRIPVSLATLTTTSELSRLTKSAAATSTSTEKSSNSTVTYGTPSAVVLPSDNSSANATTLFPTSVALTSPTVKEEGTTTNSSTILQATELNHNFSNSSTALPDSKDANAVLHLDNSLGPYDTSFGYVPDDRSSTAHKAVEDNLGCPSDGIPMADMTPSHLSL